MKSFGKFLIAFVVLAFYAVGSQAGEQQVSIIPVPSSLIRGEGEYVLRSGKIACEPMNDEIKSIVRYLNRKIEPASGISFTPIASGKAAFRLELKEDSALGTEGYRLSVGKKGVVITAAAPAGLFYGVQSFLQLLPSPVKSGERQHSVNWTVPCVEVKDVPRFGWRGMMLDVSRHYFNKEEVKRFIDEIAEYKMNVFHWHLTDDQGWRIEIKSLPELVRKGSMRAERVGDWWTREPQQAGEPTTYGGFYTQEDIKEVVEYARERYVTIMPEIDVPGHSLAFLVAYPELACFKAPEYINVGNKFYGIDENSLCAGNEKTFEYLEKVFAEVAALFPSPYIHVGGDECFKGFWMKCPKCKERMQQEGLKNVHELQSYFIRRMEKVLKAKGKRLVGWDEIHDGGLAPEANVMSWRGMKGGIQAAKQGHHVIMTPDHHCYLDLYQGEPTVEPMTYSMCRLSDSYAFRPVPQGVDSTFILGGQGNLWAESIPTFRHVEYMAWPRGWALAEVLWSTENSRNWNDFIRRVEEHFNRADYAGTNYARSMYNAIITPYRNESGAVEIELSAELDDLEIYYTFDNTDVDTFSTRYECPLLIPRNASRLIVRTFREGKPVGKQIAIEAKELVKRAGNKKRVVGNLN